jgi:hypothetical protein
VARDDYHVIVYQILSYLYKQLKAGTEIDPANISAGSPYYTINEKYWQYIILSLFEDGYIRGLKAREQRYATGETEIQVFDLDRCQITPKGIEYLTDNSFMQKAKDFFKDVKSIIPFA